MTRKLDIDDYFNQEVRIPFNLDKILVPKSERDGNIINADRTELLKKLNLCFGRINNILKKELINFIENHLTLIGANIIYRKRAIKSRRKRVKKGRKELPNLDISKTKDIEVFKKISTENLRLEQDIFILSYLLEQKIFLKDWANEKREFLKTNVEYKQLLKVTEKEFPFYCRIGALFAQGFITKSSKKGIGYVYFFKEREFENPSQLSKYIREVELKTSHNVKQYVNDTLYENGVKNFYGNKRHMKNILAFCKEKNFQITSDFKDRYSLLDN
jgi:hypothetical protein